MDVRLKTHSNDYWTKFVECTKEAVVFLDSYAGECIHWITGTNELMKYGALAIHDFSGYKFSSNDRVSHTEKAVFISPRPLEDIQIDLCDILSQSHFRRAVLIVSPVPNSSSNLSKLKEDIFQWMAIGAKLNEKDTISVDIFCTPFFIAPLTESIIILPTFRDLSLIHDRNKFTSLGGKIDTMSSQEHGIVEHLALCLDSLLGHIQGSDVVFSLGPLSGAVGSALENLPSAQQRRKVSPYKISVVIVDRSLDLCTPSSVDSKCFLDKILGALPHLPDHSIDVAVNMSPLAQATVDSAQEECLFPGCLAHHSRDCLNIFNTLIHKKKHEILLEIHQSLNSESSNRKVLSRVRPEGLEKEIRYFRGDYEKIFEHRGILQIALAVVQTLVGEHAEEAELLLSSERVLRQNIATFSEEGEIVGLLPQVTKLVSERHIRGLTLDSIITLLILLYSLIGPELRFSVKDEVQLQAAISTAMFEDQEYPGVTHATLVPMVCSQEKIDTVTANIFAALKSVSHTRRNLTKYQSILRRQGGSSPLEHVPLLNQLLTDILNASEPAIPDVTCHSTGLKDLLKSSLSMLLSKQTTSQHPSQSPNLFLFVLGGITGSEIRAVEEAWAASPSGNSGGALLVASTALLSPTDTLKAVLKSAQPM